MLDDLMLIHARDAQDALGIAEKQWQQLQQDYPLESLAPIQPIQRLVFGGMGGSALGALIAQSWPTFNKPFEISRNYDIPAYVDSNTVFFASSYSGNTEETLSALEQAEERQAGIIVITSGGKLADIAKSKNYPLLLLPSGLQPRHAVLYSLKALLVATDSLELTSGAAKQLASKAEFLKQAIARWIPTVPTAKNDAKQIALDVIGKSVVVYSGPKLWPAAYKWKISLNENAKQIAWANQYPEFNHNEFIGWTEQPVDKPYAVIDLRSEFEHSRIQKRFEVTERLLSGRRPDPVVVDAEGEDLLEQLLWTITLGDFVSVYTALLNGINPTPVDLIEKFKKTLDQ
jgi:glucose/mannose-6-phosphate isomerase